MFVGLVANIGIIVLNIYMIYKINPSSLKKDEFTKRQIIYYIFFETVVGIWLMVNATMIGNTRFDLRLVLFSLGFKYLGWKVMSPSVLLIALSRFFLDSSLASWVNLGVSIVLLIALPLLLKGLEKRLNVTNQLYSLVTFNAFLTAPFAIYLTGEFLQTIVMLTVLVGVSDLLIYFFHRMILDVQAIFNEATTDELTQLYNVRKIREMLENKLMLSNCTVIAIDIDHFKDYNDRYGHLIGDQVLQEVGAVFLKYSTPNSPVYRTGGDEFVMLFTNHSKDEIFATIKKIQRESGEICLKDLEGELTIKLSFGLAVQKKDESLSETLSRADDMLYQAKNKGRNQLQADFFESKS